MVARGNKSTEHERKLNAERAKRYRDRKAAEKYGVEVPEHLQRRRAATYRPPTEKTPRARRAAKNQAKSTAAERATENARIARDRRAEVISGLPQARNPEDDIFVARTLKHKTAKDASADTIRKRANAEKLQNAGRGLARDFKSPQGGAYSDIERAMNKRQNRRFAEARARLAALSPQTLAIFFHHEGGSERLSRVIGGILYPVDGESPDDALKRLDGLVHDAENAEDLYGEGALVYDKDSGTLKPLGKLNV